MDRAGAASWEPPSIWFLVGAPSRAPAGPASFCGDRLKASGGAFSRPMLFGRVALGSGPQAHMSRRLEKNSKSEGRQGKAGWKFILTFASGKSL